jgi:A/G-specific adenine glycosylase
MKMAAIRTFQQTVYGYYDQHGRHDLTWRQPEADGSYSPYRILVSEIMLQQTQVPRVIPKFYQFTALFPDPASLGAAPLGDVLRAWNGLGYNRRAKFLQQAAQAINQVFTGKFPRTQAELVTLPGVGKNTAGAILAYAFNEPVPFIETNIRTVFIHHFFQGESEVEDKPIVELVVETLDRANPRLWYWALMDYGAYLKQSVGNAGRSSKNYAAQSAFHGSRRQLRGQVIRLLGVRSRTLAELRDLFEDERLPAVLDDLVRETLVQRHGTIFHL